MFLKKDRSLSFKCLGSIVESQSLSTLVKTLLNGHKIKDKFVDSIGRIYRYKYAFYETDTG